MSNDAPSLLSLIAAPSNASAVSASDEFSSSGFSLSVRTDSPESHNVTPLAFLHNNGALEEHDSVKSSMINFTPVVLALTVILPSEQDPVTPYVPAAEIVSPVPSMEYPSAVVLDAVIPLSLNVKITSGVGAVSLSAAGVQTGNSPRIIANAMITAPARFKSRLKNNFI